jgi:hypothetical protein
MAAVAAFITHLLVAYPVRCTVGVVATLRWHHDRISLASTAVLRGSRVAHDGGWLRRHNRGWTAVRVGSNRGYAGRGLTWALKWLGEGCS